MKSGLPFSRRSFLFGAIAGSSCFGAPPPLPTYADATAHSGVSFKNNASLTSQKYLLESMGAASPCSTMTAMAGSIFIS